MSRGVSGPGKPASQFWQRPGRDRARGFPRSRQRKGNGDARRAPARQGWAGADGRKNPATDQTSRGVQGSCGPLVGGRRIETAGPLVLSVTKEQEIVAIATTVFRPKPLYCRSAFRQAQNLAPGRRGPGPRNQRPSRGAAAWEDRGDRCVCNIVRRYTDAELFPVGRV